MGQTYTQKLFIFILLGTLCLCACDFSLDPPDSFYGELSINRIMAIGDGYTAGFTNSERASTDLSYAGLYQAAQENAFPQLIALQYNILRSTNDYEPITLRTPLALGNGSGHISLDNVLISSCPDIPPYPLLQVESAENSWNAARVERNDNLGVPYLSMKQLDDPEQNNLNPFLQRLMGDDFLSYKEMLLSSNVDFFTFWLGINDLMSYALSGGDEANFPMTEEAVFASQLQGILTRMVDRGAIGVVGTIPDITFFPFFNTVPHIYADFVDCQARSRSLYIESKENGGIKVRQASVEDRISLPMRNVIGGGQQGLSPGYPLKDHQVLDQSEVKKIQDRILHYNTIINTTVNAINAEQGSQVLAIAQLGQVFNDLSVGKLIEGAEISNDYLIGGIFNLDGLYLTDRGQALVANEMIRVINQFNLFPVSLPLLHLNDYSGVVFP